MENKTRTRLDKHAILLAVLFMFSGLTVVASIVLVILSIFFGLTWSALGISLIVLVLLVSGMFGTLFLMSVERTAEVQRLRIRSRK